MDAKRKKRSTVKKNVFAYFEVFFRAGILAQLEEHRDEAIAHMIRKFQSACRVYLALAERRHRESAGDAIDCLQAAIRKWIEIRKCAWYRLYQRVRPMLKGLESNAQVKGLEAKLKVSRRYASAFASGPNKKKAAATRSTFARRKSIFFLVVALVKFLCLRARARARKRT